MKILITGTTGWLGSELAKHLLATSPQHEIVGLSRRPTIIPGIRSIQADITSLSDMQHLKTSTATTPFDIIIHLAGVAGWCTLEQGLTSNVLGTRQLIDATRSPSKKRQKYIIASSVGVTGSTAPHHPPYKLPIDESHGFVTGSPWAYGFSKSVVEQLVTFMSGCDHPSSGGGGGDYVLLRIGGVVTDPPAPLIHKETAIGEDVLIEPASVDSQEKKKEEEEEEVSILPEMPLLLIALTDMMRCFECGIKAEYKPGVRILTAVGPSVYSRDPVVDVMKSFYGDKAKDIDMTFHSQPGNEFKPIYETESVKREWGFEAEIDLRKECGILSKEES